MHFYRKVKFIILLLLFILILFLGFFVFFGNDEIDESKIIENRSKNDMLFFGLSINGIECSYDSSSNTYYFNSSSGIIKSVLVDSAYDTHYVLKQATDNLYRILVYTDDFYTYKYVRFTNIPLINISVFNGIPDYNLILGYDDFEYNKLIEDKMNVFFGLNYENNLFKVNNVRHNSFSSSGILDVRGASSRMYEKLSYKIELNDKLSFMDFDKDDEFALDALYIDKSKVRNKLSSDMWNLINDNQFINNDLNGQFVDVFINNDYHGLYVLKNLVDKHVTDISDDGILIKFIDHDDDSVSSGIYKDFRIVDNEFFNMKVKKYNKDCFNEFINNMRIFYSTSDRHDYDTISSIYYIDNYINYKIFVSLISGTDNISKNKYYSMVNSDSKVLITPWDLDLTWGLSWNSEPDFYSSFSMSSSSDIAWMDNNIVSDMDDEMFDLLRKRYWELRKNIITVDVICNYLDSYENLLIESGSSERDSSKWYPYNVQYEINQIREWAVRRIEFLDEYFK